MAGNLIRISLALTNGRANEWNIDRELSRERKRDKWIGQ